FVWSSEMQEPLLLIAGGSGIAPLMAMTRHRALTKGRQPERLLYSARIAQALIYRQELESLASSDDQFGLNYTLTRSHPSDWHGYARRIDIEMLREVAWRPDERPAIYLCGPTTFVEVASTLLIELGHDPARIRIERFGP